MNKVILMGRLTRDPEVRYGAGENSTAVSTEVLCKICTVLGCEIKDIIDINEESEGAK